ncbi:alpha-L-rhamnosidase C-terminal domain-containing protein [Algibacter sp. L1A34]|uniref:alpha-L-rhamnosidase-related protein n=1 Tax=Algibacter sp. L1A34 TaxID=2686365 RepID=UPI00131E016F|nr:alpha-L-rhamnosidase C-terminal domain-containing protein [Algibacter sp. L1A34]
MNKHISLLIILVVAYLNLGAQNSTDKIDLESSLIQPKNIIKISDGHYFIDFGKAFFGNVEITPKAGQNDSLVFHLGEKLDSEFHIDRNPGATIRYRKSKMSGLIANQTTLPELVPYKRNTTGAAILLPDSIGTIIPFRYCEIENLKIPIEDLQIKQKALHYKFNDDAATFSSSNKMMDSIWDFCKHTIKATSFTGYYVDGDRERIPYEADAYINQLSHYSVDNNYEMAKRTNEYFIDNPTWPTEWLLHTVLMFYTDYMYTADIAPLQKYYDNLKLKTLMDLERADGLISSKSPKFTEALALKLGFKKGSKKIQDIIDWPPAQKDTGWKLATAEGERDGYEIVPVNTAINSFYYYNLKLMTEIAGFLDKKEDVAFFKQKAEKVKETINTKLLDTKKGYYIDGEGSTHSALHANMLPLAFDLVPEKHIASVTEFVKSRGMACSVYGSQYLLEGLYKNGEAQYAADLITSTTGDRNWWNMMNVGSTMAMEAWDLKYKPNSDWNHAWGTAPLNVITRYMWGIKPKTAGFKVAQIEPQLGDLSFSSIKAPTKNGFILAEFKKKNDKTDVYYITIPNNMSAEFILPKNVKKVFLNNKKVKNYDSYLNLKSGEHVIRIDH